VIALGLWLARPFQIQGDSMRGARLPGDFVLGDNREDSEDSRFWGPVEEEQVTGRSVAVYWSWDARQERPRWRRFPRCLR
jgi:signal peptidase I